MITPKLQLTRKPDTTFLADAKMAMKGVSDHPEQFPSSAATVAALAALLPDIETAMYEASAGKIAQQARVDAKNSLRKKGEALMRALSGQVDSAAKGNVQVIHTGGMRATNPPTAVIMTRVEKLNVRPSERDGELHARWKPVPGLRLYQVQVCTDPAATPVVWKDKLNCTKAKCSLNHDLVSGTKVGVRVRAIGTNNEGPWSSDVWKTVP